MSSSSSIKFCFNSNCKDVLERSRKGWRRRTGEFADLCDRCASAYEEGKFCETFHLNASGWRCCESCGKQIHCGCIVSFHMFVLLDAGGIECITCARKSFILTPNPAWPPPSLFLPVLPERIKDFSTKNWCQIAGSGPVPWRQAPSLFTSSAAQSDFQPRMPFDVDIPSGIDRLIGSERLSASSLEKKKVEDSSERLMNGSLKLGASEILENGINSGEQASPSINVPQKSSFLKIDTSTSHFGLGVSSSSLNESNDQTKVSGCHAPRPTPPPLIGKQFCGHNGVDSSGETQIRNGRPRSDARSRNQLLPRYWPRITDQELQQISGNSNSVITPLFEKMLSASDAGRIGRLVLPKKCAEAYFPPISQPEGLPLKVQDLKGKEWIFQFRFWPNNNSRMYVLEGVTPCIQSMQLQAGDTVTFSRIEPEGKLVMGFRKASITPSSNQGNETANASNGISTNGDVSAKKIKAGEVLSTHQLKGNLVSPGFSSIDQANSADQASPLSKDDKSGYKAKEVLGAKSSFRNKRKNSILGSKSKRLRIEKEDLIELKLTWEQAQGLLRPPLNSVPSVVVIEGFEVEEYEQDAPIIGRPTIFATDPMGENIQWAQCEDCFKWRKIPADAFLPARWTCSENSWDPERSLCSVAQELTAEQLEDLIPSSNRAASKKMKVAKQDPDSVEALEGLDALANLAIQEEGEALPASSSQATTKHPRHRPGCTCIVCIQPPSGKGPKHKQTCTCNVCLTVKRRFRTLMMRREQKQSEKDAETARQKSQQHPLLPETLLDDNNGGSISPKQKIPSSEDPDDDLSRMRPSLPTFKGQIDLNIQPERDEELSPGSDSGSMMRLVQDATERYLRQQRLTNPNRNSSGNQLQLGGIGIGGNLRNNVSVAIGSSSHQEAEAECSVPLNSNALGSTSAAER
ncbi:B3 domain-containing protein Os07g0563300-like isoform X1 [Camellia sinensis]|uniref:B3 domain-containing protein Os07g0563300-like isoform X1 n=1 Tax=Camellia sinensis TaxID=4442 RepID=UPI001035F0FA|nr:B3 domain-containing protein Os07g0563300-like isoform X1 [Camellia sinensis]